MYDIGSHKSVQLKSFSRKSSKILCEDVKLTYKEVGQDLRRYPKATDVIQEKKLSVEAYPPSLEGGRGLARAREAGQIMPSPHIFRKYKKPNRLIFTSFSVLARKRTVNILKK